MWVLSIILLIIFVVFFIFLFIGGGFITSIVFNKDTTCVGLDTTDKQNIAKMTMVMFWIIFIPVFIIAGVAIFAYT